MKQHTNLLKTCILAFLFTLAFALATHAEEPRKPTEKMGSIHFGSVSLYDAVWTEEGMKVESKHGGDINNKFGASPTQKLVDTVVQWHKEKSLVPYKGTEADNTALIQKMKTVASAIQIRGKDIPEVVFLVSMDINPTYILVEDATNGSAKLFTLPPGKKIETPFLELCKKEKKK